MALTDNEATTEDSGVDSDTSWPKDDSTVASWVNTRRKAGETRLADWYESARTTFNFNAGKQWDEADANKLKEENRLAPVFNRVAATVNAICGQEVTNRQEVRFLPRRVGEVSVADPLNDAVKWVRDSCNAEDEDSDAFKDMVICGMGWTVTRMEYEENPDGDAKTERCDPMLMRWDPAARRKNLADKKWVQKDYWMTKADIQGRWPKVDISALTALEKPTDTGEPVDVTENWKYNKQATGQDRYNDQWRVIHHVERFTKPAHRAVNPTTGQVQTFDEPHFQAIQAAAKAQGLPELESNKVRVRVYWEAWTVGSTVLQSGEARVQKDFQYQAMTCFREPDTGFWYGVVAFMLDPQRYANRMASLLMTILATGPKGGYLYETGAFVNPTKAKKDLARPDSAVELNAGGLAKVKQKDPVQLPQGVTDFMQFAISSIRDVTGVNLEMLGLRQDDQPGIVEDMRTKAGLTILAPIFDAMRLYRKRSGVLLAEFVREFMSDGRLIRVWGQQGQQFIPLVRDPSSVEYDVVLDESPASRDVKEKTWSVLQTIVPGLVQMGIQIPPSVMDYLPLPESLGMEFKKALMQRYAQPAQPPPEMQKAQMQIQGQQAIASAKAQGAAAAEQARAQADVAIEHDKAQVQLQLQAMKADMEARYKTQDAQQTHVLSLLETIINNIGKVAAAEVSAGMQPPKDFTNAASYPQ